MVLVSGRQLHILFYYKLLQDIGGLLCGSILLCGKASACNVGDLGLIPGLGRSPGEGNGHLLQYSCLENPISEETGELQSLGSQRIGHD